MDDCGGAQHYEYADYRWAVGLKMVKRVHFMLWYFTIWENGKKLEA